MGNYSHFHLCSPLFVIPSPLSTSLVHLAFCTALQLRFSFPPHLSIPPLHLPFLLTPSIFSFYSIIINVRSIFLSYFLLSIHSFPPLSFHHPFPHVCHLPTSTSPVNLLHSTSHFRMLLPPPAPHPPNQSNAGKKIFELKQEIEKLCSDLMNDLDTDLQEHPFSRGRNFCVATETSIGPCYRGRLTSARTLHWFFVTDLHCSLNCLRYPLV